MPLATFPADNIRAGKVELRVSLMQNESKAELIVDFIPQQDGEPAHLYSKDIPLAGIDGVGRPTLLELPEFAKIKALGPFSISADILNPSEALSIYTDGPVRGVLPIQLPKGDGTAVPVDLLFTYMSCTATACNRPVVQRVLTVNLPSHAQGYASQHAVISNPQHQVNDITPLALNQTNQHNESGIHWQYVETVAQLKDMIDEAHSQQRSVMLNFTGPSCAVCQTMKKTVFLDQAVIDGWNKHLAIEINTDQSIELALWQQEQFHTQARPLYARLDLDGSAETWSLPFSRDNTETLAVFHGFLDNGDGIDYGTGDGLLQFILLAIGGGLFTLMMPCTYPMIPLTVNFFNKQSADGTKILPLALAYAFGIILFFTGIGVLIVFVLQSAVSSFAGNPWTNLVISLLFLLLGLSLLDVFFLRLPHSVSRWFGAGAGGYFGALLMGCTFAITAFTCTAPFAGAVLAEGLQSGSLLRPIIGMVIYASAIAVPFFILSMSPKMLKGIPHAGAWMSEVKHVGGAVEIAAAFKFLVICDFAWGWGVFERSLTLGVWTLVSLVIAVYIYGYIRLPGDGKVENASIWRVLIAIVWILMGAWFLVGLLGLQDLGIIESFFPADDVPVHT